MQHKTNNIVLKTERLGKASIKKPPNKNIKLHGDEEIWHFIKLQRDIGPFFLV
jgi:hypothetical protein